MLLDQEKARVYGEVYASAIAQQMVIEQALRDRVGKGFHSKDEVAAFAHEYHLDIMAYAKMTHSYLHVSHTGELLTDKAWSDQYQIEILFSTRLTDDGPVIERWHIPAYEGRTYARTVSERTDGVRKALYTRDFFLPPGAYISDMGCFNVAKPCVPFAKETGADTSFIYTLLEHLAGENTPYLLAWLREKMCNPKKKVEVVPIFVGAQGTGKSTFGESICRAMFGTDNVLVTYQYDSTARFNADQADALVVSIEEKTHEDKRNSVNALKSSATATHVRKEHKGVDPFYQESYTDYVLSTNDDVPIKFEDGLKQRRFMVMETDPQFTRETSELADEVFTKLYGYNANGVKFGEPLANQLDVVQQFKHELFTNEEIKKTNPRNFIKTAAYKRCFDIPRTSEAVEIETILKGLAPFIKQSLETKSLVPTIEYTDEEGNEVISDLTDITMIEACVVKRQLAEKPFRFGVCKPAVFANPVGTPYSHAVVEKVLRQSRAWLEEEYNICIMQDVTTGQFRGLKSRNQNAPTVWFCLKTTQTTAPVSLKRTEQVVQYDMNDPQWKRPGDLVRYNEKFVYDQNGCFETLNELLTGCLVRKKENAMYLDTFLLESDYAEPAIERIEKARLDDFLKSDQKVLTAPVLYAERLTVQDSAAEQLMRDGIARRVVYSGSKSLHILVRVSPPPSDYDERKWLDAYLKTTLCGGLINFDMSTSDPTRLTRAPYIHKRIKHLAPNKLIEGDQRLLAFNPKNIYSLNWRPMYEQWKNRPLGHYEQRGKRLLPCHKKYQVAAQALLEGTFFSDGSFDGQRQVLFFPAYRLIRALGYTHDEAWGEINKDIDGYAKTSDKDYWRTRESSTLIATIDLEFDNG